MPVKAFQAQREDPRGEARRGKVPGVMGVAGARGSVDVLEVSVLLWGLVGNVC